MVIIRLAELSDVTSLARLSAQLGYPSTPAEVEARLHQILADKGHALFVAQERGGQVVGWAHVYLSQLLVIDRRADLGGLVVEQGFQRQGIGQRLLEHAEAWARDNGCHLLRVNSNVIREGAHAFYQALGYEVIKTQLAFTKRL